MWSVVLYCVAESGPAQYMQCSIVQCRRVWGYQRMSESRSGNGRVVGCIPPPRLILSVVLSSSITRRPPSNLTCTLVVCVLVLVPVPVLAVAVVLVVLLLLKTSPDLGCKHVASQASQKVGDIVRRPGNAIISTSIVTCSTCSPKERPWKQ
jgi:hypothetical protein